MKNIFINILDFIVEYIEYISIVLIFILVVSLCTVIVIGTNENVKHDKVECAAFLEVYKQHQEEISQYCDGSKLEYDDNISQAKSWLYSQMYESK